METDDIKTPAASDATDQTASHPTFRSPQPVVIGAMLAIAAWAVLILANGYVAMAIAGAAVVAAACGIKGRSRAIKNLGVTAVIAAGVLLLVVGAFIVCANVLL